MDKISVVVSCPADTYSGYGARSRDFVKALLSSGKYDVKILSQRWGNTRFGYLKDHKEHELASLIIPNLTSQPDIWVQITVPNEFQKVGKYNIGVTAGIETTVCDGSWIEGCNRMDLNLVSSNHAKQVFENTAFEKRDDRTNQVLGEVRLTAPMEVLFEGADLTKYFITPSNKESAIYKALSDIPETFAYLFVGHWLQGDLGHDRKNVGWMVRTYLKAFQGTANPPALILKTQHANASISDRDTLVEKVNEIRKQFEGKKIPNIYILHGEMHDEDINELYNHPKVKAMVNFTKGEGFGRPLLEFSLINKPLIASGWSGQMDFLTPEFAMLVGGSLHNVHKSAAQKNMILKEAQWFQADEQQAIQALKTVYKDYKKWQENAKRLGFRNRKSFSYESMVELLNTILDKRVPTFPKQVRLTMPTSSPVTAQLPKLNIPKLTL